MRTSTIRVAFAALLIGGLATSAGAGPVSPNFIGAKTSDTAVSKIQYWRGRYRDGARVYGWRRYGYGPRVYGWRSYGYGPRVYGWRRYADGTYNGTRVYGWRSGPSSAVSSSAVPGGCGTYKYWDTAAGGCLDARDKTSAY